MTTEEFSNYAQSKGWHCVSNAAFGVYNGYPFFAVFRSNGGGTVTVQFKVEGKLTGAFLKGLRKQLPKGCTMAANNQPGVVALQCTAGGGSLTANLEQVLELSARSFREGQLTVSDVCPICKGGSCDALALLNGYVPVHQACVQNQTQDTLAKAEENELGGNYFTGFIGAILGGIVGALPALLCLRFLNYYVGYLYALIPIAAYQGYRILKGKMNMGAFASTIVSSLLSLVVMQFISIYMIGFQLGMVLSPAYVISILPDFLVSGDFIMSVIFLAVGLWVSWGQITRTTKHEVRNAAAVAATLQPYSSGAATYQAPYAASAPSTPVSSYKGPELDEH